MGTPYYMSPELVNHQAYAEGADMWSVGCLLVRPFIRPSVICLLYIPQRMHEYEKSIKAYLRGLAIPATAELTPHTPRQYEAAALRPPFDASSHASLAHKINAGKVARIPDR